MNAAVEYLLDTIDIEAARVSNGCRKLSSLAPLPFTVYAADVNMTLEVLVMSEAAQLAYSAAEVIEALIGDPFWVCVLCGHEHQSGAWCVCCKRCATAPCRSERRFAPPTDRSARAFGDSRVLGDSFVDRESGLNFRMQMLTFAAEPITPTALALTLLGIADMQEFMENIRRGGF